MYAPTSDHDDEEIESFYEDIEQLLERKPAHFVVVMGNLNAKVGKKVEDQECAMGKFGVGERNERGQ